MSGRLKPYWLLAPLLIIMLSILLIGLLYGILQSFGYMPFLGRNTFTPHYYLEILKDSDFLSSLSYSIYISLISSIISIVLGVSVAFAILGLKKEKSALIVLYQTPIIMPHLVAIVLVFHFLSQTGMISRLAFNLGIIDGPNDWPLMVFDNWGIGVITVYLYKQIPFVTLTVLEVLKSANRDFAIVAHNLGANRRQVLFKVILPMILPSILSAFLIIFAFTFGAFEVPFLMGSPVISTLPVKAYEYYIGLDYNDRAYTMAMNVIITVISLCFAFIYAKVYKIVTRRWS